MTSERYEKIRQWFEERPRAYAALRIASKGLTAFVYVGYTLLCLWMLAAWRGEFLRVVLVPCVVFLSGSALRAAINAPRPYEVLDIVPLIPKDTAGKSFPSRHVFSAAVIAVAFGSVSVVWGVVMALVTAAIAVTRVLAGVHWPRDVVAAVLYGGLMGLIGFGIL